jgi:hypothetical protein
MLAIPLGGLPAPSGVPGTASAQRQAPVAVPFSYRKANNKKTPA